MRWFAGGEEPPSAVEVLSVTPLREGWPALLHVIAAVDDLRLRLEDLWHVRVAVDGDAIGPRIGDDVQRAREARQRLLRQAVDQVHVDRAEPVRPAGVHHRARLLHRLEAVELVVRQAGVQPGPGVTAVAGPMDRELAVRRNAFAVGLDRNDPGGAGLPR